MWGWPLCTRSTYRFIEHYEKFPGFIRAIQRFSPFFKSGIDYPKLEAVFDDGIDQIGMGCGFINVIDAQNRLFAWGDNYGSQLGTKDDIHREEPFLIKSLSEVHVNSMSLGF